MNVTKLSEQRAAMRRRPVATWNHPGVRIAETRDTLGNLWYTFTAHDGRELDGERLFRGHAYWRGAP